MNTAIANRSHAVHVDHAQGQRLQMIPILGPSHKKPGYRLLDQTSLPSVQITEISTGGSVPELSVQNDLEEMVFLMDGQELVGAKQNRILNTDVLVAAKGKIMIPVSCVEAHRWSYNSPQFSPGKTASHRVRSSKHARVHDSLKEGRRHDADQGAVWADVNSSLAAANVSSPTAAMHDAYDARKNELDAFRTSLTLPPKAVGLAVFRGAMFLGLDLFDRHSTLKYFWESLVDSYAIDSFGPAEIPTESKAEPQAVKRFLEQAANGEWQPFKSPGEGQDWRLEDAALSGSALVWEDETVIHLQVFPKQATGGENVSTATRRPRVHRPWMRS